MEPGDEEVDDLVDPGLAEMQDAGRGQRKDLFRTLLRGREVGLHLPEVRLVRSDQGLLVGGLRGEVSVRQVGLVVAAHLCHAAVISAGVGGFGQARSTRSAIDL